MSVREVLGALGSWEVSLTAELPEDVRSKLGPWGHIVIVRGDDETLIDRGDALLSAARYVGRCRRVGKNEDRRLSGVGMEVWLGDEDDKGKTLEAKVTLTNATLTAWLTAVLPAAVELGTVHPLTNPAQRLTDSMQWISPRKAVQRICAAFGVEYRVNGNGTIDVGRADQLYRSTPVSIVRRNATGSDLDLVALGGDFDSETSSEDFTTRTVVVGETTETGTFFIASAEMPVLDRPLDLHGNRVQVTRLISSSEDNSSTGPATAQLNQNRFGRNSTALKISAEGYELEGTFVVGDNTYVYDPDTGLVDPSREVYFRGEPIHPQIIRLAEIGWGITSDHTVLFRTQLGEWLDLTRWVSWETGSTNELVVGDLPKSLTSPGSNPVLDRVDANAGRADTPAAPAGLVLDTDAVVDPATGANTAIVRATWTAPTQNTDSSPLTDLARYDVQYAPDFRSPSWNSTTTADTTIDLPAVVGLTYEVRVRAVDKSGNPSAWTDVASIEAAGDQSAPPAPADPVGSVYLGQPRWRYAGTDSLGNPMPSDANRIVLETGPSAAGPWTEQAYLTPFAEGVAYAPGVYGTAIFGRFVPYDHAGNAGPASGSVSVTPVRAGTNDFQDLSVTSAKINSLEVGKVVAGTMAADWIIAGNILTAATGARRGITAVGFQAWDSANDLIINLDGVNNLLTGRYRSGKTGTRRIEMGASGATGEINFYAPDGTKAQIRSFTESSGVEAIQFGIPVAGLANTLWNRINYNLSSNGEYATYRSGVHEFVFDTSAANPTGRFVVFQTADRASATGTSKVRLAIESTLFRVWDTDGDIRLTMDSSDTEFWYPTGGSWRVSQRISTGASKSRLAVVEDQFYVEWNRNGNSRAIFNFDTNASISTNLFLAHPFAGGLFGAKFRYVAESANGSVNARVQIQDGGGSSYLPVWASAFVVSSSQETKDSIEALPAGSLDKVRAMRAVSFTRKPLTDENGALGKGRGRRELGVVAEEVRKVAPELVHDDTLTGSGPVVDVVGELALAIDAIRELADEVDTLKGARREPKK